MASDRDIDEAVILLRSKGNCLINVSDPVGNFVSVSLFRTKGYKPGFVRIELDLFRAGCDFSQKGQESFKKMGYECSRCLIHKQVETEKMSLSLDRMLQDLADADESNFKLLKL